MLDSPNYVASKEKGELVPMVTLNKFDNEEDEWSWWEKLHIVFKMFLGDEMGGFTLTLNSFSIPILTMTGNNNPALWRIGSADENGIYMAVTDAKVQLSFSSQSLLPRCQHGSIFPTCPPSDKSILLPTPSPSMDAPTGCVSQAPTTPSTSTTGKA